MASGYTAGISRSIFEGKTRSTMTTFPQAKPPQEEPYSGSGPFLALVLAGSLGVLIALIVLPVWAPSLAGTLLGANPKAYWYLSRGMAFVALGLLWVSMILGLLITDKIARSWPGAPAAFAIHEYVSLLGLAFAIFHALILMGDRYIKYQLVQILLPFASVNYHPIWVGVGQIGLYVWAIVCASFYVRHRIGPKTWKLIHYASFFNFVVALMHGLAAGTDSKFGWAQAVYWILGGSVLFLTVYRMLSSVAGPEQRAPVWSPAKAPPPQT
jgi:predicted ferric reductase